MLYNAGKYHKPEYVCRYYQFLECDNNIIDRNLS